MIWRKKCSNKFLKGGREFLGFPHCDVEIAGFFCYSDFTWNQFQGLVYIFQPSKNGKNSYKANFTALKMVKMAVFELLKSLNWFHVKSEWLKNPQIATLSNKILREINFGMAVFIHKSLNFSDLTLT